MFTTNSGQLELDLFPGVPWNGRSPRGLTKVKIGLYLRREPGGHEVYLDPAQLDFFRGRSKATMNKRPRQTAGASLLLPLKAGRGISRSARRGSSEGGYHGETA